VCVCVLCRKFCHIRFLLVTFISASIFLKKNHEVLFEFVRSDCCTEPMRYKNLSTPNNVCCSSLFRLCSFAGEAYELILHLDLRSLFIQFRGHNIKYIDFTVMRRLPVMIIFSLSSRAPALDLSYKGNFKIKIELGRTRSCLLSSTSSCADDFFL
jgi:hypothetical protein